MPPGGLSAIEIGVQQSSTSSDHTPIRYEDPIAISNDPFAGGARRTMPAAVTTAVRRRRGC